MGAAEKEVGAGATWGSDQEGVGKRGWEEAGWSTLGAVIISDQQWVSTEQGELGHHNFTFPTNETEARLWSCDMLAAYKAGSLRTLDSRSAEACQTQEFLSLEVWSVLSAGISPKRKPQSSAVSVDRGCFLQPPKEYQVRP